jgi:hypothetical protein
MGFKRATVVRTVTGNRWLRVSYALAKWEIYYNSCSNLVNSKLSFVFTACLHLQRTRSISVRRSTLALPPSRPVDNTASVDPLLFSLYLPSPHPKNLTRQRLQYFLRITLLSKLTTSQTLKHWICFKILLQAYHVTCNRFTSLQMFMFKIKMLFKNET